MRVAILDDYQDVARSFADWSQLPEGSQLTVFHDTLEDLDAVADRLQPFEIVCAMRERTPFPAGLIERLPNLRLLVTTGKRNDAIDMEVAAARGIVVSGTNSLGQATSELAMALILAQARGLVTENRAMRAGGWQFGVGRDLHGATLGIIGLGRLGAQVAERAKPFGMHLVAWSENLTQERCDEVGGVELLSKEELLATADFVTIHQRLSERTHGLIGGEELALMKPDAYLVNTSRGPIMDWRALLDALEAGRPAGAALDVYDHEPLPADHPLRSSDRLLLTPHIGYVTRETYEVFYRETLEAVLAFLDGQPVNVLTS